MTTTLPDFILDIEDRQEITVSLPLLPEDPSKHLFITTETGTLVRVYRLVCVRGEDRARVAGYTQDRRGAWSHYVVETIPLTSVPEAVLAQVALSLLA